jgi:hypothetical protein
MVQAAGEVSTDFGFWIFDFGLLILVWNHQAIRASFHSSGEAIRV